MRTMPISKVKSALPAVVKEVTITHQPVTITTHGKPTVTMIATEDLETLMETLAWVSDPEHGADMAESRAAIEAGETLSLDEVRAQFEGKTRTNRTASV